MLMKIAIVVGYFALCVIVAWLGSRRKWGFWGYLWSSVLFTPLVGFLLILASDVRREEPPAVIRGGGVSRYGDQI